MKTDYLAFRSLVALVAVFMLCLTGCRSSGPNAAPPSLSGGLASLPLLTAAQSRSISAENPTGEKGRGGMAVPNPGEPKPAASARAADNLGQGRFSTSGWSRA